MKKPNHQGKILKDHHKVGKKFLPPLMQIGNIVEVSFVDQKLPCLVWMSALYGRLDGRVATKIIIEFVTNSESVVEGFKHSSLTMLGGYIGLSSEQKAKIYSRVSKQPYFKTLLENLEHQFHLVKDYPLGFLFEHHDYGLDREEAIEMLKEDVSHLLDRYSDIATKVQVTTLYCDLESERHKISSHIEIPNFNSVHTNPSSDEANRAASFARNHLNQSPSMLEGIEGFEYKHHNWDKTFWDLVFQLDGCSHEY